MPGIFQSLDIARRAIWASRLGMDVASHNIANVNTPGYSRQQVNMEAALPLGILQGQLGMGVKVSTISRIRNQLLDFQYRKTSQNLGKAQIKENILSQIESVIQEPSDVSIGNLMNEFFDQFSALASNPENIAVRNTLLQKSRSLVQAFHSKREQLLQIQNSLQNDAQTLVQKVNQLSKQLAELNRQIGSSEVNNSIANDLRDKRDLLLDQLSELVNIQYKEDQYGRVSVSAEGINLVSGENSHQLSVKVTKQEGLFQLGIQTQSGQSVNFSSGQFGGLLEMHNQFISGLLGKLDNLAKNLVQEVNRIHRAGKGLPAGNPPVSSTGVDFFTGTDAASINISTDVLEDVNRIAASGDGTPGNGDVAITIANLRNRKVFTNGTQSFNDFYNTLVNDIGMEIESSRNERSQNELLKDQVQNQREAESGVSLDEEMTNMIKYQRSLEAAAKVVKVVDEVLDTVVNMV